MFNFIKKATVPGVTSDKDDKEKRKRDKKDRKEKQKRERANMSAEELLRLDEVRRSLKIRGRRKDKEKLPSGITADYTADFLASLERTDSPISTIPGSPHPSTNHTHEGYTQSDSSETSLNSLQNHHNNVPPLPPKPPKRGILKTPKVSITHDSPQEVETNGYDSTDNHSNLVRNTLQNELITYQNLPTQNGVNGKNMGSQLLVITSTSPSADSLTDTTNSSFATPPFSLSPVGESQGFHRWSRTANFDDINLPLPDIVPLVLPKPRTLTIQRQKPPRNDFGFSLRRAMVLERCTNNANSDVAEVSMRAVIFAEPGTIVQHNNETGLLPGDKLLEVNGTPVEGRTREDIIDLIKASGESVTLKVQPVAELSELSRRSGYDGGEINLDDSNIRGGTLRRSGSRRFNKTATSATMSKQVVLILFVLISHALCDNISVIYNYNQKVNVDSIENLKQVLLESVQHLFDVQILKQSVPKLPAKFLEGVTVNQLRLNENQLKEIEIGAFDGATFTSLNLNDNNLDIILKDIFNNNQIWELALANNSISKIEDGAFENSDFGVLNLNNNQLDELRAGMFQDSKIVNIVLNDNKIENIENGTLQQIFGLRNFHLNNNFLKDIGSCFNDLETLWELNLVNNTIENLSPKSFTGSSISNLNLGDNLLTKISKDVFIGLPLSFLNISNNRIKAIENDAFADFPTLNTLILSHNKIGDLKPGFLIGINSKYLHLDLIDNHINNIEPGSFDEITLSSIDLANNNIQVLKKGVLVNKELTSVSFLKNQISKIEEGALEGLHVQTLTLTENYLTKLTKEMFQGSNITTLKLDKNKIEEIEDGTFKEVAELKYLDLSYNNIEDIGKIFNDLPQLIQLTLNNNKIKTLPANVFSGSKINNIFLDNNRITEVVKGVFDDLYFNNVDLSNNEISKIENGAFESDLLRELKLGSNKIGDLKVSSLGAINNKELDLSLDDNNIGDIEAGTFKNVKVKSLNLKNNTLKYIKRDMFEDAEIGFLILFKNQIVKVESGAFEDIKDLLFVDLSYNKMATEVKKGMVDIQFYITPGAKLYKYDSEILRELIRSTYVGGEGFQDALFH